MFHNISDTKKVDVLFISIAGFHRDIFSNPEISVDYKICVTELIKRILWPPDVAYVRESFETFSKNLTLTPRLWQTWAK